MAASELACEMFVGVRRDRLSCSSSSATSLGRLSRSMAGAGAASAVPGREDTGDPEDGLTVLTGCVSW